MQVIVGLLLGDGYFDVVEESTIGSKLDRTNNSVRVCSPLYERSFSLCENLYRR